MTTPAYKHTIEIEIDTTMLPRVTDQELALWWHVAQANPADGFATSGPGDLAEKVGREIIRRWLAKAPVELWHHQGRHYTWSIARQFGKWTGPNREFVPGIPPLDPQTVKAALELAAAAAPTKDEAAKYEHALAAMHGEDEAGEHA